MCCLCEKRGEKWHPLYCPADDTTQQIPRSKPTLNLHVNQANLGKKADFCFPVQVSKRIPEVKGTSCCYKCRAGQGRGSWEGALGTSFNGELTLRAVVGPRQHPQGLLAQLFAHMYTNNKRCLIQVRATTFSYLLPIPTLRSTTNNVDSGQWTKD